jgi:hypothetical protein
MTFPSDVPVEYRAWHKYLRDRPADIIVLRLIEIEDLLGSKLPAPAHLQLEWWATAATGQVSPQSRVWTAASRTATPNLGAQTVMFERERS